MSLMECTKVGPDCPPDGSSLSYPPNRVASSIFMVIFGASLICHCLMGFKTRTWSFLVAYLLGSTAEVIGYIGRILLHNNPYDLNTYDLSWPMNNGEPFLMDANRFLVQIVCLTTAPAFFSAGLYLCLGRMYAKSFLKLCYPHPLFCSHLPVPPGK